MASAKNQSLSINLVMNSAIKGADFLQVSVNKLHKTAKTLERINLLKATKFPALNKNLKTLDGTLQKIQARTAKMSRQPLTMMNAKGANSALKEQLRTQNAIQRSAKQTAFYSRKDAHNRQTAGLYSRAKSGAKRRVRVAGAVMAGTAIGAVTSLNPIRKSIDFETAMADVVKATDATKEQRDLLKSNILKQLKKGSLLTGTQIAQIQAGGGRSGVSLKALPRFTTDIARASVALDLSTEESGVKFAKMAERMNLPISKINIMTNAFTHLENNGANFGRDMINTTGRLAGIFKELKFSPQNSAAISNYMNTLEVSPELAATSFKILNNRFKKTNSKFGYFTRLQKKGAGELKNIILDITKSMSKQQIMKTFGAQGANVITKMSGDLKNLDKSLKLVSGNAFMKAVDKEYSVKMDTTGAKETMAINRIEGGSIVMGDKLKNQYVGFLNLLSNGITKITEFYTANESLIKSLGGIALKIAGVGLAIKAIAFVSSPFLGLAKGAWKLKTALSGLSIFSKTPIKVGVEMTKPKSLMGKFKSIFSMLMSFAKRNPIIIGATLATGAVMAGLNHMAKNAKPLAERQEQKGIGKSLQIKPVNNTNFDPTKKVGMKLNKGFSLKDQLAMETLPVESPSAVANAQIDKAKQVTNNNMQQTHVTNNVTINNQGGTIDQAEFNRAFQTKMADDAHHQADTTFNDVTDVAS